jgi:tetratricopeptide (TPR) repeat protein
MIEPASRVDRHLGQLESAGLIQLASTDPELEYLFRHVLVQEAAYDSLLKQERRRLHRAVAATLERLYPARREELAPVLAMHFEQAGEGARAVEYLVAAGDHALRRFAVHEGRAFFDRAVAHLSAADGDTETRRLRARIDLRRVEAGLNFVPADEQLKLLDQVRAEAEGLGDDALLGETLLLIALERTGRGEQYATSPELRDALERALRLAETTGEGELRALPLALLGEAKYRAAEFRAAVELLEEAVPLLEASGKVTHASLFAGTLALAHSRLGDFPRALGWIERASELGKRSGDPNALLDADLVRAMIEALRGEPARAIEFASMAAEQADRIDNKACAIVARGVIGEQQLLLGMPQLAIRVLEDVTDLAVYCNVVPVKIEQSRALLESARARTGEVPPSFEAFERALELARETGDRLAEGEILRQRARDRLDANEPPETALGDFEASERIFAALDSRPDLAHTLAEHGEVLLRTGRADEGRQLLDRARSLFAEMGVPFARI